MRFEEIPTRPGTLFGFPHLIPKSESISKLIHCSLDLKDTLFDVAVEKVVARIESSLFQFWIPCMQVFFDPFIVVSSIEINEVEKLWGNNFEANTE